MKVKLADIVDCMDTMDQNSEYYLDMKTGEIEWVNDMIMSNDEREEICSRLDEHGCNSLPTSFDIGEYDIMEDFVETLSGASHDRLSSTIRGRGAFERFKDIVYDLGIDQQWYDFRAEVYRQKAARWCEENGIEYE